MEFEQFLNNVLDTQLKGIFTGKQLEVLKGLLEIKFKFHSLERRVQFFNGLITALHGKKDKADVILAIAQHSGVPINKLLQVLAQRMMFVRLGANQQEGEELNRRIAQVQSESNPIRKATIFSILKDQGLWGNVKALGRRLGAAWIKQVHRLVLKVPIELNGKLYSVVALKVKRPSAMKHLEEDFEILGRMLNYFNKLYPDEGISIDTLEKIKQAIREELDFEREIGVQKEFAGNMEGRSSKLRVPVVLPGGKSNGERLIILDEYVEGKLLKDVPEKDRTSKVFYQALDEFFKQVFVDGLYHADWHEGNEFVTPSGKDVLIDVGSHGRVAAGQRRLLFNIFNAIARGKDSQVIELLGDYGVSLTEKSKNEIIDALHLSKTNAAKFDGVFRVLDKQPAGVPESLLMFLQALSKVGKYFDYIGGFRQALLVMKYNALTTLGNDSTQNPDQIVEINDNSHSKNDKAMKGSIPTGGIDFTANKTPLEIQNAGQGIKFHLNPAMLKQLQNAPGFVPVIISIQPMSDLRKFLFS